MGLKEALHVSDTTLDPSCVRIHIGNKDITNIHHECMEQKVGICFGVIRPFAIFVICQDIIKGTGDFVHSLDISNLKEQAIEWMRDSSSIKDQM
jgi:hypothetical protein